MFSLVKDSPFAVKVYTYFLRILDLNVNYYDQKDAGYQLFTWNSSNHMKWLDLEEKTVKKYT